MAVGLYGESVLAMKIGAIIQARTGSTRLPRKILRHLPFNSNISVLEQVVRRVKKIERVNKIIIATVDNKSNNIIKSMALKLGVGCFRGDEQNLLSRYFYAAKENNFNIVIRLTGDNPCIDHRLVSSILGVHIKAKNDYTITRGYPLGLNVEILSYQALEKAFNEASTLPEKEHVSHYITKNPNKFIISVKKAPNPYYYPDIRLTLDTEEDYALLCVVFDYLYPKNKYFNIRDIVKLFQEKPWLNLINKKIVQRKALGTLKQEIEETLRLLDLQDLKKARNFVARYLRLMKLK